MCLSYIWRMPSLRLLLYPVSLIYAGIIRFRNLLYDRQVFRSEKYQLALICVGNLKVGGAGKTPFTELLIRILSPLIAPATLSRGYGRKTRGLVMADFPPDALLIGDEPAQFKHKFPSMNVCVAEDRRLGISYLLNAGSKLILLDDAFQHRRVTYGLNIVLIEFTDLFKPVISLPAGNYREPLSALKRAQLVVITKTRGAINEDFKVRVRRFLRLRTALPLFFSSLVYERPQAVYTAQPLTDTEWAAVNKVILLTGIANADPLLDYLGSLGIVIVHHKYADHHIFTPENINRLSAAYMTENTALTIVLTTEKDAQRLKPAVIEAIAGKLPFYYLPVRTEIVKEEYKEFQSIIFEYVNSAL